MKFRFTSQTKFNRRAIKRRSDSASVNALFSAAAYVRTTARRSIRKAKKASRPGSPPHTRQGQLRRSILFAVNTSRLFAVVGPAASLISDIARYHEFGGQQVLRAKRKDYRPGVVGPVDIREGKPRFAFLRTQRQANRARLLDWAIWPDSTLLKKRQYPARPFMGPAMQASIHQFSQTFNVSLAPANNL